MRPDPVRPCASKDVLLLNAPRFNELIGKNPAIVEKHRGYNPPLGLLYLAGYLESHSEHRVSVLDAQPKGYTYPELARDLAGRSADVVGLTAMTFTLIDVVETCRVIRAVLPRAKIVLGGPHVHLFPAETIALDDVDFLVQGEGEIAFLDLLDKIDSPDLWPTVPGLVYRDEIGRVCNNGIATSTDKLDTLGFPARHKVDREDYRSLLGRKNVVTTMFTSRGCPFRCTFCDRPNSPVISGFRWRSASHIADEFEQCVAQGIDEAFIYDDTFTVRKDRVHDLCDEIIRRKIKFTWDVRAHVNTVDKDLLKHMSEAGCDRIHFGVEVGNDRMMKVIRKNTTVEKVRAAFAAAKAVRMETLGYFMVGQQTETADDLQDTLDLARSLNPTYAHFTIFCPYPGTQIYAQALEKGILKSDVWRDFVRNPAPDFELPVWEENFTRDELRKHLVMMYKSFYMRPGYVLRSMTRIRSSAELMRKARAGLSVFTMTPNQKLYKTVVQPVPGAAYPSNS
ncbi:B12-binding domain-containing radical SAM protein [Roseospira navarrensis]|nr:radical SAM protein [Roseospira navarrensis]